MSQNTKPPVRPRQSRQLTLITTDLNSATAERPAINTLWVRMTANERRDFVLMHWGPLWDIQQAINPHFG
jgi:hypothetical protein